MASLILTRQFAASIPNQTGYTMILTITSAVGIDAAVFLKQRVIATDKVSTEDNFAAVCSLAQLIDYPTIAPLSQTGYWRDSTVTITVRTPEYAEDVYQEIVAEVQKLVLDYNVNQDYSQNNNLAVTIDSDFPPEMLLNPPVNLSPTGANPTITVDHNLGTYYIINFSGATGTASLRFLNMGAGDTMRLEVIDGSAAVNITFPTNTIQGKGGGHNYTSPGVNTTDLIKVLFDGTNYLIESEEGYS